MNREIELLDRQRMSYLGWSLVGFLIFIILSIARFFFRLGGYNSEPIGMAVLAGLLLSLMILIISSLGTALLSRKIRHNPQLKEALYNELIQALEIQSWKAAFFAAIVSNIFFTAAWFFYPVCDPVMLTLTTIIAGLGSYQATFYLKYRSL